MLIKKIIKSGSKKIRIRRRVARPKRIVINLLNTKYKVIKYVAKMMKWKISYKSNIEESDEWDVCWSDGGV